MIIKHPEQHMSGIQQDHSKNCQASVNQARARLFELIMNKSMTAQPPCAVPSTQGSRSSGVDLESSGAKQPIPDNAAAAVNTSGSKPANGQSSIRMTVSDNISRIAANEIRQNIDYQAVIPDLANPERNRSDSNSIRMTPEVLDKPAQTPPETVTAPERGSSGRPDTQAAGPSSYMPEKSIQTQQPDRQETTNVLAEQKEPERSAPFWERGMNFKQYMKMKSAGNKEAATQEAASSVSSRAEQENIRPGQLAARFESANRSDAIGYDQRGGTCYGIYQLSSGRGTMGEFLDYLDEKAPDISSRLRQAGPDNTGSNTGAMPKEWKEIDKEQHERFASLQHDFIFDRFYVPAARRVESRIGLKIDDASPALREVLWSTAVQHGVHGALSVFQKAAENLDMTKTNPADREIIQEVYRERRSRFSGSAPSVRVAVQNRFNHEMKMALAMLPGSPEIQA